MASKWKAGILAGALMLSSTPSVYAGPRDGRKWDDGERHKIRHVLLLSIDGMHALDLKEFVENHPNSNLARLSRQGITFGNALTSKPSDSFPGLLSIVTGGSPPTERITPSRADFRAEHWAHDARCSSSPARSEVGTSPSR